jgi:hypothetical protein
MFVFRLRSAKELLDNVLYELSALYPKKTLVQLYEAATREPFAFLYVNLMARDKLEMFYRCFETRLVPEEESYDGELPADSGDYDPPPLPTAPAAGKGRP